MYIRNYPEDSTLRRHYESAAAFQRQTRLAQPPMDSVLHRHYEQLHSVASASAGGENPAAGAAPPPAPRVGSAEPATGSNAGGGFFGWLKRLFG